jgi:hypothetical protein
VVGLAASRHTVPIPPEPMLADAQPTPHAAILRSPSQSVRSATTWFQLGVIRDAGSEIRNGLGAFLYVVRFKPGFSLAFC